MSSPHDLGCRRRGRNSWLLQVRSWSTLLLAALSLAASVTCTKAITNAWTVAAGSFVDRREQRRREVPIRSWRASNARGLKSSRGSALPRAFVGCGGALPKPRSKLGRRRHRQLDSCTTRRSSPSSAVLTHRNGESSLVGFMIS